jgi:hypothetical protein
VPILQGKKRRIGRAGDSGARGDALWVIAAIGIAL